MGNSVVIYIILIPRSPKHDYDLIILGNIQYKDKRASGPKLFKTQAD